MIIFNVIRMVYFLFSSIAIGAWFGYIKRSDINLADMFNEETGEVALSGNAKVDKTLNNFLTKVLNVYIKHFRVITAPTIAMGVVMFLAVAITFNKKNFIVNLFAILTVIFVASYVLTSYFLIKKIRKFYNSLGEDQEELKNKLTKIYNIMVKYNKYLLSYY